MTSQLEHFEKLFATPEPLDPELGLHVYEGSLGMMIKHPLVFSICHHPVLNAMMNAQLRAKKDALAVALAEQDWSSYIWLHERPYRVDGFIKVQRFMSDSDYWELLGQAWIDSENIPQNPGLWYELLGSDRPERECIMDDDEREALAAAPDHLVVFQGHTTRRDDGWSWTLSLATAEWFAERFARLEGGRPRVTTAIASKVDVIAYFTRRNESEVLIDRARLTQFGRVLP